MSENDSQQLAQQIYQAVCHYVLSRRNEELLFNLLKSELAFEHLLEILGALGSIFHFLQSDLSILKAYLVSENIDIQQHHIEHFIEVLNDKILIQNKSVFVLLDYNFSIFQEKVKRAVIVLSMVVGKQHSIALLLPEKHK